MNKIVLLVLLITNTIVLAKETRANLDGRGNMVYLDRHHVNCGNRALRSFKLFRPTSNTIAYQYSCSQESMGQPIQKETRADLDGGGNMVYLDRQRVECNNMAILGFKLFRPTSNTVAYMYTCGSKKLNTVQHHETRANLDGRGNVIYLDRQYVNCGNNYITYFKLFRPTSNTVAYQYGCGF